MGWRDTSVKVRANLHYLCNVTIMLHIVGIPVFGPSALAARMEGSKAFSKDFMARHNIPTAAFRVFAAAQYDQAVEYVKTCEHPVVLKASGLAGGKGVLIPQSVDEAVAGLKEIMVSNIFGSAGVILCSSVT
jgi:phosphoribosylamine--glycine ligase/phosphoribosylformylglycinamidine cyclo-ligase